MKRAVIVIPAYEPTPALADLVAELSASGDRRILVINDGSSRECRATFERVARCEGVVLLEHAVNLGKGQALKTAFNYVLLNTPPETVGVVTADADGQHLAADIRRVADRLEAQPATLVLGSRGFEGRVPLRNKFGNVMTRGVFRLLIGKSVVDTQTGLRGIPRAFLPELLQVEAGRYEFELEMLIRAADERLPIDELPITTVYAGAKSHFNPLRDSLRIYFVFLRFIGLSIVTAGIDYATFAVVYAAMHNILLATVLARVLAGTFNFTANRTLVFRSRGGVLSEALKYAALVFGLMWVSYGLVTTLVLVLGLSVYVSKLLAEGSLFAASFALQNLLVFADRSTSDDDALRATDWDAYYRRPALFAPLTRRVTERVILREVTRAQGPDVPRHIAELGGGNSPFLIALHGVYPDARLTALDTNALGLRLLAARLPEGARVSTIQRSVLAPVAEPLGADVVFSVGLIEHFDPEGTARAVAAHFEHARPGAIVLITYPTPTWLYRLVRGAAERLGIWAFPDERPLAAEEVTRAVERHGRLLRRFVNWPTVLTQGVMVARKHQHM